jgi:hypothetical protein
MQNANHAIAKISKYLLKKGVWNDWMKNNNLMAQNHERPFQIATKFFPNRKFGRQYWSISKALFCLSHLHKCTFFSPPGVKICANLHKFV